MSRGSSRPAVVCLALALGACAASGPGDDLPPGTLLVGRTARATPLDRRLGELAGALDGDDLLIVFSDHGSRTALEHDTRSLFLAAGGGVRPGRLESKPELRGVSRMLAELLGVATDWPQTELSEWARTVEAAG